MTLEMIELNWLDLKILRIQSDLRLFIVSTSCHCDFDFYITELMNSTCKKTSPELGREEPMTQRRSLHVQNLPYKIKFLSFIQYHSDPVTAVWTSTGSLLTGSAKS